MSDAEVEYQLWTENGVEGATNAMTSQPEIGRDIDVDSLDGHLNNTDKQNNFDENACTEINRRQNSWDTRENFDESSIVHETSTNNNPNNDDDLSQSNSSTTESSEMTNSETTPFIEQNVCMPSFIHEPQTKSRLPVKRSQSQTKADDRKPIRESLSKKFWRSKTNDQSTTKSTTKSAEDKKKPIESVVKNTVSKFPEDRKKTSLNVEKEKKLPRCESQTICQETSGIRETVTSRMRFEKRHVTHEQEIEAEDYLTPTQRKEQLLKDLKQQVKDLTKLSEERDEEIQRLKQGNDADAVNIIRQKDSEIRRIQDDLKSLQNEHDELKGSYQKSLHTIVQLEERITELKDMISDMEKKNDKIYLEMYKKGQESATFERNVELERLAASSDCSSMTMNELIRKLVVTESELAKWQSFRRQESYESVEKPETQADVTLRFLKDSFFHYLTDSKEHEEHLRAMIRIFKYTDVQKKKITASLTYDKKNKIPPKI